MSSDYFERVEGHLLDAVERHATRRARPGSAVLARLGVARRWLGARPGLLALTGILLLSGSAAGAVLLAAERSQPLSGIVPPYSAPRGEMSVAGSRYTISLTPSLQAGTIGWCNFIVFRDVPEPHGGKNAGFGGGSCGVGTAALGAPLFAADGQRGAGLWYVLAAPQVAAVHFLDGPTVLTRGDPRLPFGFRVAVASLPQRLFAHGGPPLVSALAADGRVIPGGAYQQPPPSEPTSSWSSPAPAARGACALTARPGSAVRVLRGSVIAAIVPDRGVLGHAFISCEDAEISLHGRAALLAAVLLDAKHPGSSPAPLPDMQPVNGSPGVFARSNPLAFGSARSLLARRDGAAWLMVAGAENVNQGLQALRALRLGGLDLRPPRTVPRAAADAECAVTVGPRAGLQEISQENFLIHGRPGRPLVSVDRPELTTCTQAEFYFQDRPLTAMVMFHIGKPGLAGQLRSGQPVPGRPGLFTIPAEVGGGRVVVRRSGRVWLEVDGDDVTQELAVLDRLHVRVARSSRPVARETNLRAFLRVGGLY